MRGIGTNLDFIGSDPSVTVHQDGGIPVSQYHGGLQSSWALNGWRCYEAHRGRFTVVTPQGNH